MATNGKRTRRHSFTTLEEVSRELETSSTQNGSLSEPKPSLMKEDSSSHKRPLSPCASEGSSPKRPATDVAASTVEQQTTSKTEELYLLPQG